MVENENNDDGDEKQRITVEATDVEGVVSALGLELAEEPEPSAERDVPEALTAVLETVSDIYAGVEAATEADSRGRSRKMVREYAGREDLDSEAVGHLLRVLEGHDLVVQDGNRWRIPAED